MNNFILNLNGWAIAYVGFLSKAFCLSYIGVLMIIISIALIIIKKIFHILKEIKE